ncbi:Zinc finger C2H2-type [Trinorchestia longiramus]|nr:Zinc finger C2H2-type [Trinorchestia longiramus]
MQAGQHDQHAELPAISTECNSSHGSPLRKKSKFHDMEGADASVQAALQSGLLTIHRRGNEGQLKCTLCLCPLTGPVSASEHLSGDSHAKVYRRHCSDNNPATVQHDVNLSPGVPDEIRQAIEKGYLRSFIKDGHEAFHCNVCQAPMTGTEPTISHLHGEKHRRRIRSNFPTTASPPRELPALNQMSTPASPEVKLEEEVERGTVELVTVVGVLLYKCTVCNVTMTGKEPANAHLAGKSHKKLYTRKRQGTNLFNMLANTSPDSVSSSLESTATTPCLTSDLGLDASNSHPLALLARLNLSSDKDVVSAALSSGVLVEVHAGGFVCRVCSTGTTMCGRTPALAHLMGQTHAKSAQRIATLNSVSSTVNGNKSNSLALVQSCTPSVSRPASHSGLETPVGTLNLHTRNKLPTDNSDYSVVTAALANGVLTLMKSGLENYECSVCSKTMVGRIPACHHLQGAPHLKALNRRDSNAPNSMDFTSTQVDGAVAACAIDELKLHCKVCCVSFRSKDALVTHLTCKTHLDSQKKQDLKNIRFETVIKSTSEILSALTADAGQLDMMAHVRSGEIQVLEKGKTEEYKCVPCQVLVTSVVHLRSHLLGRAHQATIKPPSDSESTRTVAPAAPVPAVKQERDLNNDDDDDSASSESDDSGPIIIREDESISSSRALQAFLRKIRRKNARKSGSE